MSFPNRYGGTCAICRKAVAAQAGYAFKAGSRWSVCCSSTACGTKAGLRRADESAGPVLRRLARDVTEGLLRVDLPYDEAALPLLRALPGSTWDKTRNVRTCSGALADLPRVLEIADRLGLDVEPTIRTAAAAAAAAVAADTRLAHLYPFQRDGVQFLRTHTRALLGDDMGLGKTIQVLAALADQGRAIVICPAVVKYNWQSECARWRPNLRVTVLSGRGSFRLPDPGEIVVVNYDLLPEPPPAPKKGGKRTAGAKVEAPWRICEHEACKADPIKAAACAAPLAEVTLIVDEAHLVKNYKAQRTRAVTALAKRTAKTWFLTGTPLPNRALDLWGVLSAGGMERDVFGGWTTFTQLFGGFQNKWGGWEFGMPSAEAPERLRRIMLRRTKAEVLPELPPITYQQLVVNDLTGELEHDLDELWEEHGEEIRGGSLPPFERFSSIRAKLAASRVRATLELVEQYEEAGTPLIVFSAHRAPIDALADREGWAVITGDTSAQDRAEVVRRFQAGELKGVGLTIAAGGIGITLTHASTALFVDLAWRPADNWQAEDRMRRIGQLADKLHVIRMVSRHPLDLHVQELLAQKIALVRAAVENTAQYKVKPQVGGWTAETEEAWQQRIAEQEAIVKQAEAEAERKEGEQRIRKSLGNRSLPLVELSEEQAQQVREAFAYLDGVCDGARTKDDTGFNASDQGLRRWLRGSGLADPESLSLAYHVLRRYPRQIEGSWPELFERRSA